MPPGPGSEVGFEMRCGLTIEARGSEVERLEIYKQDYDPHSMSSKVAGGPQGAEALLSCGIFKWRGCV